MGNRRARGPGHATLMAVLALVVGLTGTATAVTKIGTRNLRRDAVTTKKLADDAVTAPKLAEGAVGSSEVADGSLQLADLGDLSVDVAYDPPNLNADTCAASGDIGVPGMQGGEEVLVMPGSYDDGWPVDFFLDAYGASGPSTIRVRVCNYGATPTNAAGVPLRVVLFR